MPLWTDICYCLFCCASRENLPNSGFKHIIGKTFALIAALDAAIPL